MVMIIEIFVAQYQAMNPLTDKFLNADFCSFAVLMAAQNEAFGSSFDF